MPIKEEANIQIVRTPKQIVSEIANKYGIPYTDMSFIVENEGGWNQEPCVQSYIIKNGKRENSWGGFQINLDWNPQITKKQSCDWHWSAEWTAKQLDANRYYLWTSLRNPN